MVLVQSYGYLAFNTQFGYRYDVLSPYYAIWGGVLGGTH